MIIKPIAPSFGSTIEGVDLAQPLKKQMISEIYSVWLDRQVIILRGQTLSPEQYLAFAKQLGDLISIIPF